MANYKILILSVCLCLSHFMQAQVVKKETVVKENRHKNSGFIDFNGYYYTREYGEMTVNILANLVHTISLHLVLDTRGSRMVMNQNIYSQSATIVKLPLTKYS